MVERISVQIALEGGDAIQRQLADIGQAGQKAFADIQAAADKGGGFQNVFGTKTPEEVTAQIQNLGVTGADAIEKIQAAVSKATGLEKTVQTVALLENTFISLGKVAVSALGGWAAAIALLTPSTLKTAEAFSKVNQEAIALGLTATQFDKMRLGLGNIGISSKVAADGITHLKGELDKLQLDKIKTAFQQLQEAASRGFGAQGTTQLQLLQKAAEGVGPAADLARQELEKLGLAVPAISGTAKALADLGVTATDVAGAMPQIFAGLERMPDSAQRSALAIQLLGRSLGTAVIAALQAGQGFAEFNATQNALTQEQANQAARMELALGRLENAWQRFSGLTFPDAIIAGLDFLTQQLEGVRSGIEATTQEFSAILSVMDQVAAAFNTAGQAIGDAASKLAEFLGLSGSAGISAAGGGGEAGTGFAGGGMIGGRGTGTSDSNLAWVSRGEHIMPAASVAQPGVLAFLEALRRSGGNLSAVLNGMGRFALGGMVPAAGGGMSNVTIAFPGLPAISGLHASAAVVDQLRHAAALAQVRSGGRKPSRYT